jgi:hypothetical protein
MQTVVPDVHGDSVIICAGAGAEYTTVANNRLKDTRYVIITGCWDSMVSRNDLMCDLVYVDVHDQGED